MSLQKISLQQATHEQLLDFADAAGIEVSEALRDPEEVAGLQAIISTSGHGGGIFVATPDISMAATAPMAGAMLDGEFDPENERWIRFSIMPDQSGEEAMSHGAVYVAVNQDSAYIPRGEIVVCREMLFRHLQVKEVRYYQNTSESTGMTRGKRIRKIEDRYPMTVYGVVGYVKDGPPDLQDGDILIAPGGSQAAAISAKQQRAREQMAA